MANDRKKVLEMLAEGKISAEDAEKLLSKLDTGNQETEAEESTAGDGPRPLKYLRVLVDSDEGNNVNIRVPIPLVRTGLMLSTMIPVAANEELRKQGVDLSGLSKLNGEELIEALREFNIDVRSANGDTVRVFCE